MGGLFGGFGGNCGCRNECDNGGNCMWLIMLLLLGNCGCGIGGCVDVSTLIFILLLLSICDNGNNCCK